MKVRTQARRDAILETAAGLFQEMGYERASMNELAKRLGGSKATLYSYFSSKEGLFSAVVRAYATQHLTEAAEELTTFAQQAQTLAQKLLGFGERMLSVLTSDNKAMSVYRMVVGAAGHSDIGTLFYESGPRESLEKLAVIMTDATARGELRAGDPRLLAAQFLGLVTAEITARTFQRYAEPLSPARVTEITHAAVDMFLSGAAARRDSSGMTRELSPTNSLL
ncbi:TetR/AcrR family transcriptional regulator [Sodalis sp. C49]|uniref:TetR/AcrR family transcriptional regulator n=1 Tax=Sodalis sp. C49 TaxID=3228929 RepID=UPI00396598AE